MKNKRDKIFVAMSGGVDSSVAALLLKNQEYDTVGVFMRCYNIDGCAEKDAEDARRVAEKLDIPFYVWDFEEEYKKKVVDYMVDGYRRGLTPNPDVMCNKEIKFGMFLERALSMGADYVATGHYVRVRPTTNDQRPTTKNSKSLVVSRKLLVAVDANKDQSYFLWTLTQEQLRYCFFPIGDYLKSGVRAIAKKAGLPTAEKKDSQGICFLGRVTLEDFLGSYLPAKRGAVLNTAGEIIGEHSGAHFYTIGQRHGLFSGDWKRTPGTSKPFYVAGKNVSDNTLVVAEGEDSPELFRKEIKLNEVNFIDPKIISLIRANKGYKEVEVLARVRYRQPLFEATLIIADDTRINADKNLRKSASKSAKVRVLFRQGQKFIAAGQSAVFYVIDPSAGSGRSSGELRMLGGGVIV